MSFDKPSPKSIECTQERSLSSDRVGGKANAKGHRDPQQADRTGKSIDGGTAETRTEDQLLWKARINRELDKPSPKSIESHPRTIAVK